MKLINSRELKDKLLVHKFNNVKLTKLETLIWYRPKKGIDATLIAYEPLHIYDDQYGIDDFECIPGERLYNGKLITKNAGLFTFICNEKVNLVRRVQMETATESGDQNLWWSSWEPKESVDRFKLQLTCKEYGRTWGILKN